MKTKSTTTKENQRSIVKNRSTGGTAEKTLATSLLIVMKVVTAYRSSRFQTRKWWKKEASSRTASNRQMGFEIQRGGNEIRHSPVDLRSEYPRRA